jgi:hypothetical protein
MVGCCNRGAVVHSVQETLLQAALVPPEDDKCRSIVEMAASVGVMYLSTMAGALPATELVMIATLLNNNRNLLMVENLIAAVWILLKCPENRRMLGTAFAENPVLSAAMKDQMQVGNQPADHAALLRRSVAVHFAPLVPQTAWTC